MPPIDWNRMFGSILDFLDSLGNSAISSLYGALSTTLAPVFWATTILWIAYWGFELLTMKAGVTPGVFIIRVIKLLAIYTFAFHWVTFQGWVVEGFNAMPGVISGAVCKMGQTSLNCTGDTTSIGSSLDQIWAAARNTSSYYMSNASWYAIGAQLQGIVILLVAAIMLAIAAALLALSKVTLFLLLALAPIFISMALFNFTSGLFSGWMNSLFTVGIVLPALIYGILGVMIGVMQSVLTTMQQAGQSVNAVNLDTIGPFLIMSLLTVFLLVKSEAIAHGIAGGPRMGTWEGTKFSANVGAAVYNRLSSLGSNRGGSSPPPSLSDGGGPSHNSIIQGRIQSARAN